MPDRLRLDIVTADRIVYSDLVDVVIAPGVSGEMSILPRHAPLLTMLQPGEIRVRKDGVEVDLVVGGGFLEVEPNRVIVLADAAERAEEIDAAKAQAALERAERLLAERRAAGVPADQADMARALAELRRSRVRLKVARHRPQRPQGE